MAYDDKGCHKSIDLSVNDKRKIQFAQCLNGNRNHISNSSISCHFYTGYQSGLNMIGCYATR